MESINVQVNFGGINTVNYEIKTEEAINKIGDSMLKEFEGEIACLMHDKTGHFDSLEEILSFKFHNMLFEEFKDVAESCFKLGLLKGIEMITSSKDSEVE